MIKALIEPDEKNKFGATKLEFNFNTGATNQTYLKLKKAFKGETIDPSKYYPYVCFKPSSPDRVKDLLKTF